MADSNVQLGAAFTVSNIIIPKGGPKACPVKLDFTNSASIYIDGSAVQSQGKIEYVQCVFIDNADNANPFALTMGVTGQRIVARAHSQGYYALLMPNPPQMLAETGQVNGLSVGLFFLNVPVQQATWDTA